MPVLEPATSTLPAPEPATASPARTNLHPATSMPPVTRHLSPPNERCHECRSLVPPLLDSGERPSIHCNKCGTALRPPGSLVEFCPKCRHVLQELNGDGTRPAPRCLHCNTLLPPPLPPEPTQPPRTKD